MHGLTNKLKSLNIHIDESKIPEIYKKFSEIADKKKEVYDEDLFALISDISQDDTKKIRLKGMEIFCNLIPFHAQK